MFGLFKKKKAGVTVHHKVWSTNRGKFNACVKWSHENADNIFIAWFGDTKKELEAYFKEKGIAKEVYFADRLSLQQQDKNFIFVEVHPLYTEEQRIANHFLKKEITVFASLEEPFFKPFGGDSMKELVKRMGIAENEIMESNMITNSLKKAQEKISSKCSANISAQSQKEWMVNAGVLKL